MKTTVLITGMALALNAPALLAGHAFEDYARVTSVTPEYEKVNFPRKECVSEYVPERVPQRGSMGGPIIGGIAGGILGAQVGKGNGRIASSAAGAAIGAIVGDRLSQRPADEYYEREVRRCRMVDHWDRRLSGYRVAYEYQGRPYETFMSYDPGPRLPVRVSVAPAAGSDRDDDWNR
jgi:uncharacterized protein YcfJ